MMSVSRPVGVPALPARAKRVAATAELKLNVAGAGPDRPLWFPGKEAPEHLDGSMTGDYGCDPFSLSELRHAAAALAARRVRACEGVGGGGREGARAARKMAGAGAPGSIASAAVCEGWICLPRAMPRATDRCERWRRRAAWKERPFRAQPRGWRCLRP